LLLRLTKELATEKLSASEIMSRIRLSHRAGFWQNLLNSALKLNLIERTIPYKPNIRLQKYRIVSR
jgi:hypothetical protein